MHISRALLRWYRSFNINYLAGDERRAHGTNHPWNKLNALEGTNYEFPFVEIPIEKDVTTVVGGNEAGKSHLLSAISKVLSGKGLTNDDTYSRTDLCHFAALRSHNANLWPNIGLQLQPSNREELERILEAMKAPSVGSGSTDPQPITLILSSENDDNAAYAYIGGSDNPIILTSATLQSTRALLPRLRFLDSNLAISDQIHLSTLLAAYDDERQANTIYDYATTQTIADTIIRLKLPQANQHSGELTNQMLELQDRISKSRIERQRAGELEVMLFRDILKVDIETLDYIATLGPNDRSYIEGIVAEWNRALSEKLNLAKYWQQDDKFTLRINYKQGIIFFEITDKTNSVYTFRERSSGLRYFLSYYIQAKAMELSGARRNSVIVMDEPDSFLSTLGQKNLLAVFESIIAQDTAESDCQLVYTTHSPFLINRNFPHRIRLLRKGDAEEGTQYHGLAIVRRYEPVRSALGIDCAQTLFMGMTNLLMEGPTDQFLFTECIRVFSTRQRVDDFLDLNAVTIISAESAPAVEKLLTASQWGDEPVPATVVILDSDSAGQIAEERITGTARNCRRLIDPKYVKKIGDLLPAFGENAVVETTEDVIPRAIYLTAVGLYCERWYKAKDWQSLLTSVLVDPAHKGKSNVMLAQTFIRDVIGENESLDKLGVAVEVIRIISRESKIVISGFDKLRDQLIENMKAICITLRVMLEESARTARKTSGRQAIHRLIHEFRAVQRRGSSMVNLQRLVDRIVNELETLGDDGDIARAQMHEWKDALEKQFRAGVTHLADEKWAAWNDRLEMLSKDPFNPPSLS